MKMYLNQPVTVTVSGYRLPLKGKMIDLGSDIVVLFNGLQYLYLPLVHLQHLTLCPPGESDIGPYTEPYPDPIAELSYRKVLLNAKGKFVELFISGNQTVHGYITSIMNDFFVFHSPMFRALYVSMHHLKLLIPYDPDTTPYAMKQEYFPVMPTPSSLARTFEQQLRKLQGSFVVLDLGDSSSKIGQLKSVQDGLIELVTAAGVSAFLHIDHVKTIHRP